MTGQRPQSLFGRLGASSSQFDCFSGLRLDDGQMGGCDWVGRCLKRRRYSALHRSSPFSAPETKTLELSGEQLPASRPNATWEKRLFEKQCATAAVLRAPEPERAFFRALYK